jgi:2-polyprenyl-3-methyl-5-hydroxy-6-metoxy-1,4-benzoquinol methylase
MFARRTQLLSLSSRNLQPEQMDASGLDPRLHRQALAGLKRINLASRTAVTLWPRIRDLAVRLRRNHLRVLDVACGGGDVALRLWQLGRRSGIDLEIVGLDKSPLAVEMARASAGRLGAKAEFDVCDVLEQPLVGRFDAVVQTLFLHHLTNADAARLLRHMAEAADHLILVSDLRRGRYGYLLAQLACRLLSRSPIVHADGPQSVAAAFSINEAEALCHQANLENVRIEPIWPARFLLSWQSSVEGSHHRIAAREALACVTVPTTRS